MRKGPRNPFRMFALAVDRDAAVKSSDDNDSLVRRSADWLRGNEIVDEAVKQTSRQQPRKSRVRCGAPMKSSFLFRGIPMIYWTYRNDSMTCLQEYGFNVRPSGGNVFSDVESCVRQCCPLSCRPQCCADLVSTYDDQ